MVKAVTRYQTSDGCEHASRVLAEHHETSLEIVRRLALCPEIMQQGAKACVATLSRDKEMRTLVREWLITCERLDAEIANVLQPKGTSA